VAVSRSDDRGQEPDGARGVVLGPDEGRLIVAERRGDLITLKLTREQTQGSIGVLEATTQPGGGPPRHIHRSCDELFYVLQGEFLFLVGDQRATAGPGSLVFIPRGVVHAAKVIGSQPGRVLAAYVPGGQEHAFEEFGRSPREVVAAKCDSEFVGPPL